MLLTEGEATRMTGLSTLPHRSASLRAIAGALLLITSAACSGDGIGPTSETALPGEPTAAAPIDSTITPTPDSLAPVPTDSTGIPPIDSTTVSGAVALLDTRSKALGIVFASDGMRTNLITTVHTGAKLGGAVGPSNVISTLADARERKGRVILKLCMGADSYVKNSDGTFSFTKWKTLVDRFRGINLDEYIKDGTILAHFIIDEPHRTAKWGGKVIPHATLEAMAAYSKSIWPEMHTMTHTQMAWLTNTSVVFKNLDAGWAQYTAGKGEVNNWITTEINHAKRKGMGMMVGVNALGGGGPNSGIKGYWPGKNSMNATEIRTFGAALLKQTYACAFMVWAYNANYYGRSDIKAALGDISAKAKIHAKTSCRQ